MNITLTGTTQYNSLDDTAVLSGRFTIRDDKFILWTYTYDGEKKVRSVKRRVEDRKWWYSRRQDTSGQYFELLTEYTPEYAWDRWTNSMTIGELKIQTWNRKELHLTICFEQKREMVREQVSIILDEKSRQLFNDWVNCVVNAE